METEQNTKVLESQRFQMHLKEAGNLILRTLVCRALSMESLYFACKTWH